MDRGLRNWILMLGPLYVHTNFLLLQRMAHQVNCFQGILRFTHVDSICCFFFFIISSFSYIEIFTFCENEPLGWVHNDSSPRQRYDWVWFSCDNYWDFNRSRPKTTSTWVAYVDAIKFANIANMTTLPRLQIKRGVHITIRMV